MFHSFFSQKENAKFRENIFKTSLDISSRWKLFDRRSIFSVIVQKEFANPFVIATVFASKLGAPVQPQPGQTVWVNTTCSCL